MWLVKEVDLLGVAVSGKACLALTPLRSSDPEFNSGGMLPIVSGSHMQGMCWILVGRNRITLSLAGSVSPLAAKHDHRSFGFSNINRSLWLGGRGKDKSNFR